MIVLSLGRGCTPQPIPPETEPAVGEISALMWQSVSLNRSSVGCDAKMHPPIFGKAKLDTCIRANETSFPLKVLNDANYHAVRSFIISCVSCSSVPYSVWYNDDCSGEPDYNYSLPQDRCREVHSADYDYTVRCNRGDSIMV